MPTRFWLTAIEFDVLWAELDLGCAPPLVLRIGSAGRTHGERRDILAAGRRALRERGLLPDAGVAALLRLLADPDEQLELRADWGPTARAVAARRDGAGALAVLRGGSMLVSTCASAPTGLLSALPAGRPGSGRAVSVPSAALAAAVSGSMGGVATQQAALRAHGVPGPDARLLSRTLGTITRQAQVVALRRGTGLGRVGGVLRILEGADGRYLMTGGPGPDGVAWITLAPVDAHCLRHRVGELLAPPDAGPATTAG